MKKLNYIIIVIIGLLALCSCEDAIDSAYVPSTQQNSDNEVICDNQLLANEINQKFLNIKYTNMSTAAYNSTNGDSGGIIYTYVSAKNKCYTVGVHKGSTKSGLSVYSKADLVLTALKISRY